MAPLVHLCKTQKIKLVGIDLKNSGLDRRQQEIVDGKRKATKADKNAIEKIVECRAQKQISMVKRYLQKTRKPLVVIVGAWHLRNGAPLRTAFNQYTLIYPCDTQGKMLVGPAGYIEFRILVQPKTDLQCFINALLLLHTYHADALEKPALVDGTDLVEENF